MLIECTFRVLLSITWRLEASSRVPLLTLFWHCIFCCINIRLSGSSKAMAREIQCSFYAETDFMFVWLWKQNFTAVYDRISKNQNVVRCLRYANWNFKDDGFVCIVCVCACVHAGVLSSQFYLLANAKISLCSFLGKLLKVLCHCLLPKSEG